MDPPVCWRNRTNNFQITTNAKKTTQVGTGAPSVKLQPTGVSGTTSLMADNNHPDWFLRQALGQVVMGDMSLLKNQREYEPALLTFSTGTAPNVTTVRLEGDFGSQVMGNVTVPYSITDEQLSNARDQALLSAYAKITQDSVMSSEVLLGLGKTVNMLRKPFSSAYKHLESMFKSASRHYGKTAESITKANASAWLEYRYGMLPTYLDVNQVIKMYGEKYTKLERRRAVVRSGGPGLSDSKEVIFTDRKLPVLYNIGYTLYASGKVECIRIVTLSAGVVYEVAPRTTAEELAIQYQLGSQAIMPSLWEQIPFSFVADWFVNVGDWLAATHLPPDVRVLGNWTTSVRLDSDTWRSSDFWMMMNNAKRNGSWGLARKYTTIVSRCTNRPLPTLPVVTQKWATITHAADAASLALGPILTLVGKLR